MGLTPNVVDGNVILAAWGNETRDRACQVFASPSERDQQWPDAPDGALCVTLDTGTYWRRQSGGWVTGLNGALLTAGDANSGQIATPAAGLLDSLIVNLGVAPCYCTVAVRSVTYFGFGNGWINATTDAYRYVDGVIGWATSAHQAVAGAWASIPVNFSYNVPAGGQLSFKLRYAVVQTAPAGNFGWYDARASWQVFGL